MNIKKKNRIPSISPDRLDLSPIDASVGSKKEDKLAYDFLKGKESVQPFTIRIPVNLYQKLREIAFKKDEKINKIVIKLIESYINEE